MDEAKLQSDAYRGGRAKSLIDDELLNETLAYLKQSYIDAWGACKTTEMRENAWYLLKGVERFQEHLQTVLNDGMLAQRQIEELVKAASRRKAA